MTRKIMIGLAAAAMIISAVSTSIASAQRAGQHRLLPVPEEQRELDKRLGRHIYYYISPPKAVPSTARPSAQGGRKKTESPPSLDELARLSPEEREKKLKELGIPSAVPSTRAPSPEELEKLKEKHGGEVKGRPISRDELAQRIGCEGLKELDEMSGGGKLPLPARCSAQSGQDGGGRAGAYGYAPRHR